MQEMNPRVGNTEPTDPVIPLNAADVQQADRKQNSNITMESSRVVGGLILLVIGLILMLVPVAISQTQSLLALVLAGVVLTMLSGVVLMIPMEQR